MFLLAKASFGLVGTGETSGHQLAVSGLAYLKRSNDSAKPIRRGLKSVKICKHSECHLVELDDGSKWQIFPGDLDVTLNWQPDTNLKLGRIEDDASSRALVSETDNTSVRVLPLDENWSVKEVKGILRDG